MKGVRVREIEMAYDDEGSGPAILLLHGYPFNRSMWKEQTAALSEKYRVIAPDLRGLGETAVTGGPAAATMSDMARDVAALLDELGIERVTLGGLSMGGYVTLAFYRRFPLRVRALILADTKAQGDTEDARHNRESQAEKVMTDGMESIADDFLKKVLTNATLSEKPEVVAHVREMILKTDPRGAAAALRGMAARHDQTDFLEEIIAPTLILVGSEDNLTPPADAELMRREIRGSRLEILQGASHLSNLEQPHEFNRALLDFLAALQP
jgi:pimeloyl-ACP methyl ester carboxylesterase